MVPGDINPKGEEREGGIEGVRGLGGIIDPDKEETGIRGCPTVKELWGEAFSGLDTSDAG